MHLTRIVRLALPLAVALLCDAPVLHAQAYTPPPPPLDAPCKPTKKDPCTVAPPSTVPPAKGGLQYAFPTDTSDAVKLDPNADPNDPANKPAPPAPAPTGADGRDSNGKFPFPGDAPASSSSSGSSSSGSSSSAPAAGDAADDDDPPAPAPVNRRHLPKVEDLGARESEDIDVSGFYFSKGDFMAAYNRAKDAVRLMPDDPEAHFALAQAAGKLGKTAEARDEYGKCLKLDIEDSHARVARAALEKLP